MAYSLYRLVCTSVRVCVCLSVCLFLLSVSLLATILGEKVGIFLVFRL